MIRVKYKVFTFFILTLTNQSDNCFKSFIKSYRQSAEKIIQVKRRF